MSRIEQREQPAALVIASGREPSVRLLGAVLGGTLAALAYAVLSRIGLGGEFASHGNTLEGFPFDALMSSIGIMVGLFLGFVAARRVVDAKGPVRWIIGLAFLAPPLGGFVFLALTAVQQLGPEGDLARVASWIVLVPMYSYVVALPTTIVVSLIGTLLLRRLVQVGRSTVLVACAVLIVSAAVVGGGSLATTVGVLGIGPGVPARTPTLTEAPVARATAIPTATPYANELSLRPAVFVSADALYTSQ